MAVDLADEVRKRKAIDDFGMESSFDYDPISEDDSGTQSTQNAPEQNFVLTPVEGMESPIPDFESVEDQPPQQPETFLNPATGSIERLQSAPPSQGAPFAAPNVALASREIQPAAPRAELVKLPPVPSVAAASRELDLAPAAEPVRVERGQLVGLPPEQLPDDYTGEEETIAAAPTTPPTPQPLAPQAPVAQPNQNYVLMPVDPTSGQPLPQVTQPAAPAPTDLSNRVQGFVGAMKQEGFDVIVTKSDAGGINYSLRDQNGQVLDPSDHAADYGYAQGSLIAERYGFKWGGGRNADRLNLERAAPATTAKTQQPATAPQTVEPDLTEPAQPGSYTSYQGSEPRRIQGIILHSSDGSLKSDINTLTGGDPSHNVSAHYYTAADGTAHHFVADNDIAYHAGATTGQYGYLNNNNTIGIEQEHVDGTPWRDEEVRGTAKTVAELLRRYPNLSINDVLGHSDIAPERKQDPLNFPWDKFRSYVAQDLGQQPAQAQAPVAQPGTKLPNGFYQNEDPKSFISGRATTFATPEDIASGADPGVGSPKLGRLDTTQVAGVAVPQDVLQSQLGNNPAAWRKARVDVVDAQTGKRLRLPIVDVGPSNPDALFDMTPWVSNYFGGDKTLSVKLVANAGPDVTKNPGNWGDEQAAIRQGFDSSALAPGAVKVQKPQNYVLAPVVPSAEGAALQQADQFAQASARTSVMDLPESQSGNVIGLYKRLDKPVQGVNDAMRGSIQAGLKGQIIELMRDKYPELKTDDEAWAKALSDVGPLDVGREWFTKALGYAQQFTNVMQKGVAGSDQLHVNQFLDSVLPGANDQQKHDFLSQYYALPQEQKGPFIASHLPQPQAGIPSTDPQQIVSALDRLSDSGFQQQQAADLAKAKAEMERNVSSDPRLRGTFMEKVVDATAQLPSFIASFSNPVLRPLVMAQIADQVREGYRQEHPEWDEKTLTDHTAYATLAQFLGAEAANAIMLKGFGPVVGGIENKAQRAIAQAVFGTGSQAAIAASTQAATNIIAGDEPGKNVGQAALSGAIQGAVTGGIHGIGELGRAPVRPSAPVREEPPAPPVDEGQRQQNIVTEPKEPDRINPGEVVSQPEPEPKAQEQHENDLTKQADDIYERNKAGDIIAPIEERPISADIIAEDERIAQQGELGRAAGEVGQLAIPDINVGPPPVDIGRPAEGGGQNVPPELGRVPRPLESRLSGEERAAYDADVEALRHLPLDEAKGKAAFQSILGRAWQKWAPRFKAGGIERADNPRGFDGIAASSVDYGGDIRLFLNHDQLLDAMRTNMGRGNDPVAYLHSVLEEELIHSAEQLSRRDQWKREKVKTGENFIDYKFRRDQALLENWLNARDQALKRGNTALASDITDALHSSVMAYQRLNTPEAAEAHINDLLSRAKAGGAFSPDAFKARNQISNLVGEFVRQPIQLQRGDIPESFWKRAMGSTIDWFQNALNGLKSIYAKLAPGQALARTDLAKMIRATERKLNTLYRRAAAAEGNVEATGTRGEGIASETFREDLTKAIGRMRRGFGLTFKSGESAMLDYKETRPLAVAIRRMPSEVQRFGQQMRILQLKGVFDSIPKGDRERVVREFTDYIKAEQKRQPLPIVGGDTMRLIAASKDSLERTGQIMRSLGVKVRDGDIIRDVKLIGRGYFPRMISADTRDIFNNRDGSRAADFNRIVNDTIAKGVVKNRQEFIDKFTHAITGEGGTNDHFSNLEKARKLDLPLDLYDFSPETLLRYLDRANNRLAQISTMGQKLANKGKDVFDRGIEEVNKNPDYDYQTKEDIIKRINSVRQAQYQRVGDSAAERAMQMGRNLALSAYLGNQGTAIRNLITGAAQNFAFGGPINFLKTAATFPLNWRSSIAEARERNILRTNLKDVLRDYDLASNPSWLNRTISTLAQKAISFGGHNLTENINRAFGMQQAKLILQDFMRDRGMGKDNPITRGREAFILRRFGTDDPNILGRLAREGGSGPLTDEFLRQHVMDIHANYGPSQIPENLVNNAAGRAMFQFQRWGANTARMATREFLMPLARAIKSGDPGEIGYHAMRNLGYLATAVGAGSAVQATLNALYNRDPKDPTFAEIGKALQKGNYAQAFQWWAHRAWGAFIASGFSGLFGDYWDTLQSTLGLGAGEMQGRPKDPLHPPLLSLIEPVLGFANGWRGETLNFTKPALPSSKLVDTFMRSVVSEYRVAANIALGTAARFPNLHMPWSDTYAAKQDVNFTRDRIRMFEEEYPALQQKREAQGTKATALAMSGRGPFDPTRERIINGLISGNEHDVSGAIRQWLEQVPKAQVTDELKRIKQTISTNSPLKVGGSTKPQAVMDFLSWAHDNLPESEARRVFGLASTYAKTALSTGLESSSKEMLQLSRLDYDKFKAAQPNVAQAARQQALKERQGQIMMQNMVRRQQAAGALQGR